MRAATSNPERHHETLDRFAEPVIGPRFADPLARNDRMSGDYSPRIFAALITGHQRSAWAF